MGGDQERAPQGALTPRETSNQTGGHPKERSMFRKQLASIVSDEGFMVRVLGRSGLEYREGTRHDEVIDDARRERIVDNIRRAFKFDGFDIDVA
jgi:hypothetical protein